MNRYRSIHAYLLILIYGILLLHDMVPHTHIHLDESHNDHSHNHTDHDHDHESGLFDFLKGLIHSHSEVADAQHHDLAYKATSFTLPFWFFMVPAIISNYSLDGSALIAKKFQTTNPQFYWRNRLLESSLCLRAPPMS